MSLLWLLGSAARASAQRVHLPGPAGARSIVGVVTDTDRRPLDDVERRERCFGLVTRTTSVRSIDIIGAFDDGLYPAVVNGGPDRVPLW